MIFVTRFFWVYNDFFLKKSCKNPVFTVKYNYRFVQLAQNGGGKKWKN